ncbi:MAG: hypothetical protein ACQEQL_05530 [Pseudomonadota bacterium]
MKKLFSMFLALLLFMSAFAPWLPHGSVHALHDHQAEHHSSENHSHSHEVHSHSTETEKAAHHPIRFDVVTYFNDFLHVDLQSPAQIVLKAPVLDAQDIDYAPVAVINTIPRYELAFIQRRAFTDMRRIRPDKIPLYLSTQRLRI